jgi:ribosomal protein L35AE/L33A
MPGAEIEYFSTTYGCKWIPGVVSSFDANADTYCLSLQSRAEPVYIPAEAVPQKIRAAKGGLSAQAFMVGDHVEYFSVSCGSKWVPGFVQSFNSEAGTYHVKFTNPVGEAPKALPENIRSAKVRAAQAQAFMPNDKVEYFSATMGGKWIPGVVQSFNPESSTYHLNMIPRGHVPEAAAEKVRAARQSSGPCPVAVPAEHDSKTAAFMLGQAVYYCSKSLGKLVPGVVQSFNPQTNTYFLNLIPCGQVPQAAAENTRIRGRRLLAEDEAKPRPDAKQGWFELEDLEVWPKEKKIPSKDPHSKTKKRKAKVSFADEKGRRLEEVHFQDEVKNKSSEASHAHCIGGTSWIIIDQVPWE